jgi:hypothetical protein
VDVSLPSLAIQQHLGLSEIWSIHWLVIMFTIFFPMNNINHINHWLIIIVPYVFYKNMFTVLIEIAQTDPIFQLRLKVEKPEDLTPWYQTLLPGSCGDE